ncbi:superoxide dismutase family protein [Streptomyces sodiiphilus]
MKAVATTAAVLVAVLAAAVPPGAAQEGAQSGAVQAGSAHDSWQRQWGVFAPPGLSAGGRALTYDTDLVPSGARVLVTERVREGRTVVGLTVRGVRPGHTFGTHVHTRPCGPDPAQAGPHYQHRESGHPRAANPWNEVWLDFTADASGDGRAVAKQDWTFRAGQARSVVLHELPTSAGHHGREPGDAGPRAACLTVPFGASEATGDGR